MEQRDLFTSYDTKHIVALILDAHKRSKEAIHLSLKIRVEEKCFSYQFLVFFRVDGDPSVFFAEGLHLEEERIFYKISHRDPQWESTIENVCFSLPGWDSRKGNALAMVVRVESTMVIARPGELGEFVLRGGNLFAMSPQE